VSAALALRDGGAELDVAVATCIDHILAVGAGLLRGSRFGRTPEVLAAAFTLADALDDDAAWDVVVAAVDLLAVAIPPAPSRGAHEPAVDRPWPARVEDWGRPALVAGAVSRLEARLGGGDLRPALARSFPAPRRRPPGTDAPWIEPSPDGVVVAAARLFVACPGFREAAAVLVAREAWADPSSSAVGAAAWFVEETRRWAVRRRRLEDLPAETLEDVDATTFEAALRDAAGREAVHSFGVVHALAAAAAHLRSGSEEVSQAAGAVLAASRPTWSPGRPPGVKVAPRKYRA